MRTFGMLLCGLALGGCLRMSPRALMAEIAHDEDQRSLAAGGLVRWARSAKAPEVRARAYLALARMQVDSTLPTMVLGFGDPEPQVRRMAIFAAGELAQSWEPLTPEVTSALERGLLSAESTETDPATRTAILLALGKVGQPASLAKLVERLEGADPAQTRAAATALGVAARKGAALPARAFETLPQQGWAGVYALSTAKVPAVRVPLEHAAGDPDIEVRALVAKGLGDLAALREESAGSVRVLRALLADANGRVAAEAARALVKYVNVCSGEPCLALLALQGLDVRVGLLSHGEVLNGAIPLLAFAQGGISARGRPLLASLRDTLRRGFRDAPPARRSDLANLDCRLAAAMDRQTGTLEEVLGCGAGVVTEARRLVLGLTEVAESPRAKLVSDLPQLEAYLRHPSAAVRGAAIGLIAARADPFGASLLRPFIADADPVLASQAALGLGALRDVGAGAAIAEHAKGIAAFPEFAHEFSSALSDLKPQTAVAVLTAWLAVPHVFVRQEAARALSVLEGHPRRAPWVEGATGTPVAPQAPPGSGLRVETARGAFVIRLDVRRAPMNSAQLLQLARRGFFRNLTFHRIVPNFVVQGGDPHGDGAGGPGFTLRCEINETPYRRGTVGMALSGKDTGGSQFFVTESTQPHLDGRYTVVGEVVSGMDVVDALLEGDVFDAQPFG